MQSLPPILRARATPCHQHKIHVFDIPELLIPICAHLAPNDLLQCILLSRHFNTLCIPLLYASISILTPLQFHRFRSLASRAALARHSAHIRSFKTQYYSILRCLLSDAVDCRNLTHLEFPKTCRFNDPDLPRHVSVATRALLVQGDDEQDTLNHRPQDLAMTYEGNAEARARNALGLFDETLLVALMEKCPRLSVFAMASFPFDHDQLIRRISNRLAGVSCAPVPVSVTATFDTHVLDDPSTPTVSPALTMLPTGLKRLELTNQHYCRVRASSIEYLLNHCTPELEELLLSISFGSRAEITSDGHDMEGMELELEQAEESSSGAPSREFSSAESQEPGWSLRRLAIKGDLSGPGPIIWLPLLRKCTQLQEICVDLFADSSLEQLASTLGQYCPRVVEMTLQCMIGPGPQEDSRISNVIQSSLGWKRLSMSFFHGFGPLSTTALIKHSSTLESLVLEECDGLSSEDIQAVLSSCPNLRTFRAMTSNGMDFSSTVYLDANEMVDSPWVCSRLEHLKLMITGIARPDLSIDQYGNPLLGPLHDGTITGFELQRIVYRQLGQLSKLQELWLGHDKQDLDDEENYHPTEVEGQWRFIDPDEQFECLEFSLKSGLDLLSGLKDLRVLNLDRMKTRIGLSEVQWMAMHWPRLERVIGLVVQGEQVPKHVQWMYDHWPDVELPAVLGNFFTAFS